MMEYTDRHDRFFLRLLSRHTALYTEMLTTAALLNGDTARLLAYDAAEHPLALQLGGSEPRALGACTVLAAEAGYDEVNLNVGCPSARVRDGRFGACLMLEPDRVADGVRAMRECTPLPVTIKMRIGVDTRDSYDDLLRFTETVARAGCRTFIVHARKAWLRGLSPKRNRAVPPLRHDIVQRLKRDLPALEIVLNGGIRSLDEACRQLRAVDGVMLGRAAYHNPYLLAAADARVFGDPHHVPSRHAIIAAYLPYVESRLAQGTTLGRMTRHLLGLFHGVPGARAWRRYLTEHAHRPGAGAEVLERALALVPEIACPSADPHREAPAQPAPSLAVPALHVGSGASLDPAMRSRP